MLKKDRLSWIYSSKDSVELAERYDEWADSYDQELEEDYGWQITRLIASVLSQFTPASARVLDAGAGTGLVGQYLGSLGYDSLVAMDISNEMLNKAREKMSTRSFTRWIWGRHWIFPTIHSMLSSVRVSSRSATLLPNPFARWFA